VASLTVGSTTVARGGGDTARWSGKSVLVPVRPVPTRTTTGRVCLRISDASGHAETMFAGAQSDAGPTATYGDNELPIRLRLEYLMPTQRSWWAFAPTVAERIGFGHAWSGTSVALLAALLTATSIALAAWQLGARTRLRTHDAGSGARRRVTSAVARVPTAAWVCALVAFLNAASWSIIIPAFQVPDEQSHYAYTEYLVEHGQPPIPETQDLFSDSQATVMEDLKFGLLQFRSENGTIWLRSEQTRLEHDMAHTNGRSGGNGSAHAVAGEPPLYYVLEGIPAKLAASGTVLDRLALMRLLSALLGGVTVLLIYLFLREALPAHPWTWTVGALGVAFQPLFGFVTGGVNSDALLYAAAAGIFYLLARGFRRGLSLPIALGLGLTMAVGVLTKFNFLGLLPGVAVALLVLSARAEGGWSARTVRLPAIAIGIPLAAMGLEMTLNTSLWNRPAIGASASAFTLHGLEPSIGSALSYVWQFYLAPLPGMTHYLGGFSFKEHWVVGFVGLYGWIDTRFRPLVYDVALIPLAAIALLALRTLVTERTIAQRRRAELLVYTLIVVSFMGFVATASYIVYTHTGSSVAQARYLFPLLPIYAAGLALATRGAGARWTPVVGVSLVTLALAHDVFSQLLVISRYYA
jgi:hypothetical protein